MAGTITVAGFASSTKTPGSFIAVVFGGPGTSSGAAPISQLHVGNMIGTAITGAGPSFSVAAGTASLNVVVPVYSPADAATKFGAGSELHMMAISAFAHDPAATLYAMPVAQGSTAATQILTFTGTAPWTSAGVVRLVVNGRSTDVAFAAADSLTTVALNCAIAINAQPNWPVTAQSSAGVLTITAKHTGLRSNNINVRGYLLAGTSSAFFGGASPTAAVLVGLTATPSGGTGVGGLYFLSGGTTEESLVTPLTVIAGTRYGRIVLAQQATGTTTNTVTATMAQVVSQAGPNTGFRQQVVAASIGTTAAAVTVATARNTPRLQVVNSYNNDWSPGEIAAAVSASRVAGDANIRSVNPLRGESTIPSANLDGLNLLVPPQFSTADVPTPTVCESSLNTGVVVLMPRGLSGGTYLPRSITSYFLDNNVQPTYAVIDTEFVTVCDWVADALQSAYTAEFAGFNVVADDPSGAPPRIANVTSPTLMRAWLFGKLKDYEGQGINQGVDALASLLAVILDPAVSGRLLAEIPCRPVYNLHQLGSNVRQIS